jgi:hypothetical protein
MTNGANTRKRWFRVTKSNNTTEEKVEILTSRVPEDVKKAASWALIPLAERRKNYNDRIENFLSWKHRTLAFSSWRPSPVSTSFFSIVLDFLLL